MFKRSNLILGLSSILVLMMVVFFLPVSDANVEPAAKKSFVGSDTCKICHSSYYKTWSKTAHTKKTQPATKKTVVMPATNKMTTTPDGKAIFKLQFRGAKKLYLTLYDLDGKGAVEYRVQRVMGGTGVAGKQRLVISFDKDGNNTATGGVTHLISPIQYNHLASTPAFNAYHPEHWYKDTDDDGTMETLITNDAGVPLVSPDQYKNSWERRCVGCHATGPKVAWNRGTGFFTNQSSEFNIGCEACHGPGSAHASAPAKDNIIQPDKIADHKIATYVCARCHIRGSNINKGESHFDTGYPAKVKKTGRILFMQAGNDLEKWYTPGEGKWGSDDPKWRKYASAYNFSKSHHQQGSDWIAEDAEGNALNKHYGSMPWQKKTCWECHTPHSKGVEGPQMAMKSSDNSLCLSCHAGHGFANEEMIMEHTKHSYDPTGKGTSRCVDCHMPKTAKSQAKWEDHTGGDIHSHAFEVVKPGLTKLMAKKNKGTVADGVAIPNGCNGCHTTASDYGLSLWKIWEASGGGQVAH